MRIGTTALVGICFILIFLSGCYPSRIHISSLPSQIERIEGHASLRINQDQNSTRSKFVFLFQLPDRGRVTVRDFLGRTIYQIVIEKDSAFFVLPSKKVYWQGEEEEILDKFLGFRLSLSEMISLLSGQWYGDFGENMNPGKDWVLERDERGRIKAGRRGELSFEVEKFIEQTPFARILIFNHPFREGRVKILSIGINEPLKKGGFSLAFINDYEQKTWAEIQELIENAS